MNQKVLPLPGSLSTPTSPPISCASRRVMASPRPVPPYLRVVEASACSKASNSRGSFSGAMPMPVSCTSKRTSRSSPSVFQQSGAQGDGALLGELDGVAGVVEQGLAQPGRVAAQPLRHLVAVDLDRQPLGPGLFGDQRAHVVQHGLQREVGLLQLQPAGLDLGQVEDVVDDGQQVPGGGVDLVQPLGLLGRRRRRAAADGSGR